MMKSADGFDNGVFIRLCLLVNLNGEQQDESSAKSFVAEYLVVHRPPCVAVVCRLDGKVLVDGNLRGNMIRTESAEALPALPQLHSPGGIVLYEMADIAAVFHSFQFRIEECGRYAQPPCAVG